MAEPLDVAARLAEGRPAVDNIGEYVWACHLLGYQNPDLTLHTAQVRDWYGSEDGLDLRALDADRAALDAVAAAADSARQLQEQQVGALAGAWQGRGGDASREFLLRHGAASAAAASAVRDAVDALAVLRDDLWHAVDDKVAGAVTIDDRRQAQRAEWLTATRTVTTGAGDRAAASELIDQQVKPFVDNDIRADWLAAMQRAMAAVSAAFDAATSALTGDPTSPFEVPGDLGPTSVPPPPSSASPAHLSGTEPAAWSSPAPAAAPAVGPSWAPVAPVPAAPVAAAPDLPAAAVPATGPASATPAMPTMPPLGELGGGLPGAAGGLAGIGSQLADAISGLLDQPHDALPDPSEVTNDAVDEDKPAPDENEPAKDEEDEQTEGGPDVETAELAEEGEPTAEPVDACGHDEPVDEAPQPDPVPTPPPAPMPPPPEPLVESPPDAAPVGAETPCEIAADELPQAGP
jgi:surface antigen